MTTWTWQDYTPTPEEEEAWMIKEKEAEKDGFIKPAEQRKTTWIGEFEFLEASAIGMKSFDFCLIHRLHEVKETTQDERNEMAIVESLDWIVPNEYKGEIAFSQGFMRNLGGNIKKFEGV